MRASRGFLLDRIWFVVPATFPCAGRRWGRKDRRGLERARLIPPPPAARDGDKHARQEFCRRRGEPRNGSGTGEATCGAEARSRRLETPPTRQRDPKQVVSRGGRTACTTLPRR